jgi:hypothetical protein
MAGQLEAPVRAKWTISWGGDQADDGERRILCGDLFKFGWAEYPWVWADSEVGGYWSARRLGNFAGGFCGGVVR